MSTHTTNAACIAAFAAAPSINIGVIQPADLVDLDGTISSNITDTNGDGINSDDLWTFFVARLKSNGICGYLIWQNVSFITVKGGL